MTSWKRDAASGLVVLVPILVTIYVVAWLFNAISRVPFLQRIIEPGLFGGNAAAAEFTRVILTLLIFGAVVLSIGYLMRTALGTIVEEAIDDVINQVPGLRVVYNASKMAIETTVSGAGELNTPVKIELWGVRLTAFKTGKETVDGKEVIFLPTAPNITTGFVMEVDPDEVIETDERVEDALTRILSAGFGESKPAGALGIDRIPDQDEDQSAVADGDEGAPLPDGGAGEVDGDGGDDGDRDGDGDGDANRAGGSDSEAAERGSGVASGS